MSRTVHRHQIGQFAPPVDDDLVQPHPGLSRSVVSIRVSKIGPGLPGGQVRTSRWPVASIDADFSPYLDGMPATSAELFWRFVELARAPGPVTFELQNKVIVLSGTRRIFASVRVLRGGLGGHLNLTRRLADRRIGKTENLTSDVVFHRYLVSSMSDLDEEFGQWLAEARAVGNGAHPAR